MPPQIREIRVALIGNTSSCQVLLSLVLEGRELPVEFVCSADTADQFAEILQNGAMQARWGLPSLN